MSSFEYLSRLTIGQYLPIPSPLHRLDPRARILMYAMLVISLTFAQSIYGVAVGLVIVLGGLLLGHIPIRFALKGLIPPLPFLLIIAAFQVFFSPYSTHTGFLWEWGAIRISITSLWNGLLLILRFCALILAISLATFTLSTSQMISGLRSLLAPFQRMGIPTQDFVMMVQITLRFLPFLAQAAERIAKAQASRGAEWDTGRGGLLQRIRNIIPLLIPLFLTSLRRAENLATAMEARGYASAPYPTAMEQFHFRYTDAFAILLTALLSAAILLL